MQTTSIHDGATTRLDDPDGILDLFAASPAARRAARRLVAAHLIRCFSCKGFTPGDSNFCINCGAKVRK